LRKELAFNVEAALFDEFCANCSLKVPAVDPTTSKPRMRMSVFAFAVMEGATDPPDVVTGT
jgi:hypothetical protein